MLAPPAAGSIVQDGLAAETIGLSEGVVTPAFAARSFSNSAFADATLACAILSIVVRRVQVNQAKDSRSSRC